MKFDFFFKEKYIFFGKFAFLACKDNKSKNVTEKKKCLEQFTVYHSFLLKWILAFLNHIDGYGNAEWIYRWTIACCLKTKNLNEISALWNFLCSVALYGVFN